MSDLTDAKEDLAYSRGMRAGWNACCNDFYSKDNECEKAFRRNMDNRRIEARKVIKHHKPEPPND